MYIRANCLTLVECLIGESCGSESSAGDEGFQRFAKG